MEYDKEGGGGPVPVNVPPPPVYTANNIMVPPTALGPYSMSIRCPHCYSTTFSQVTYSSGLATYLLSGGCCLLGGALGCFLIPFCLDSAKDVHHFCPHCKNFIGAYKRIG